MQRVEGFGYYKKGVGVLDTKQSRFSLLFSDCKHDAYIYIYILFIVYNAKYERFNEWFSVKFVLKLMTKGIRINRHKCYKI